MHHNTSTNINPHDAEEASVLASLRALLPERRLQLPEALRLAELQANRLLELRGITDIPVPLEIVSTLPRIVIRASAQLQQHGASGASGWSKRLRCWFILVNPEEPPTRQRFTVLHEYKHIIDHYHPGLARPLPATVYGLRPAEYVAEFFAGCVLMPRRWLKAAYGDGIQRIADLAELFDVSPRAMEVRLSQLGLTDQSNQPEPHTTRYRVQPQGRRPLAWTRFQRPLSQAWMTTPTEGETTV